MHRQFSGDIGDTHKTANKRQRTSSESDTSVGSPTEDKKDEETALEPPNLFEAQIVAPVNVKNMLKNHETNKILQRLKASQIQARIS